MKLTISPSSTRISRRSTFDPDMRITEAEEELKNIKESFKDFMRRYEQDPQNVHQDLNQSEIDSLKHVDPDVHVEEEVFYYCHQSNKPTIEES